MPSDEVTLALLVQKVDLLTDKLDTVVNDHEHRLRLQEERVTRISERLNLWQGAQAIFTTVASIIATLLGRSP